MEPYFHYKNKKLKYNRINYNNGGERCVEVPIAFDFLASIENKSRLLEIGNVLSNYENELSRFLGIDKRRIVDKFEKVPGVENIDIREFTAAEKFSGIVCISTVEHVGLDNLGETNFDKEGPLNSIARIYSLLEKNGKALITFPFGKLLDGGWYMQFSLEYFNLLKQKFNIPEKAINFTVMKKVWMEPVEKNGYQTWVEVPPDSVSEVEYGNPWPFANACGLLELTKLAEDYIVPSDIIITKLNYDKPPVLGGIFQRNFIFNVAVNPSGTFDVKEKGPIFTTPEFNLENGIYKVILDTSADNSSELIFSIISGNGKFLLQKSLSATGRISRKFAVKADKELKMSLYNSGSSAFTLKINKFEIRI